jgi:hypothetical protein
MLGTMKTTFMKAGKGRQPIVIISQKIVPLPVQLNQSERERKKHVRSREAKLEKGSSHSTYVLGIVNLVFYVANRVTPRYKQAETQEISFFLEDLVQGLDPWSNCQYL